VRLVFDVADLAEPLARVRAFVAQELPVSPALEVFVAVGTRLRARVVVADGERALITSGELTGSEEDGFLDVGVLLQERAYVRALEEEWARLVASGVCVPVT
jgi:hypothetical protein